MKTKIYQEINKLVILGIIKKDLSEVYSLEMAIHRKNSDISKVVADLRGFPDKIDTLEYDLHIVGYNSKKLLDATENYFIAALDLFGELITQRTDHTCSL